MIISEFSESALLPGFEELVANTRNYLNKDAGERPAFYKTLGGRKIEPHIKEVMVQESKHTPFEGSITLWGGQRFPDIVAKKYFGVEVKTTIDSHWTSTGNSILESTRVEDVEHIFIMFGQLATPVSFRSRLYQECLSDIVVTHYPRYLIDMNLEPRKTIFDKMQIEYNDLRKRENPIEPVAEYYRKNLKEGESLWWLGSKPEDVEQSTPISVRLWKTLSSVEKSKKTAKGMVYFPEVFGSDARTKFDRFTLWLVTADGVVGPHVRDSFSAGGQVDIGKYVRLPRICKNAVDLKSQILKTLMDTPVDSLASYWGVSISNNSSIIEKWIDCVSTYVEDKRISYFLKDNFAF